MRFEARLIVMGSVMLPVVMLDSERKTIFERSYSSKGVSSRLVNSVKMRLARGMSCVRGEFEGLAR